MNAFWRKVVFLIRRGSFDRELAEEMRHHVEMKAEKLTEGGVPHDEARYRAQQEFGNAVLLKESSRDFWQWRPVEELAQDLRYGLRMLRRSPGFTCVAVATLALGIAANTTIFSVVSAILLKAPPVTDPDRVMMVLRTGPRDFDPVSAPDFIDWRDQSKVFEEMAAANVYHDFSLTGQREPERLTGMQVSANYFHVLGVSAMLGRTFLPGEDQPGHDPVVVLGHGLWQRRFASDPGVIGKTVGLDGQKFMIVGVMPAAFRLVAFPNEMWTPLVFSPRDLSPAVRQSHFVHIFARLYAAMQRTHEIGIRIALGARKSDVLRLVVGKGMLLTLVGTAIGLAGALPLPRLLAAAFQDFSAQASVVFIGVPVLVGVSALVASYIPARRAANVDPMVALRYE